MKPAALLLSVIIILTCGLDTIFLSAQEISADVVVQPAPNEDEAAIRKAIDSYVEKFNRGDAKAVAEHWSEGGEFSTPSGEFWKGRKQLEAGFTKYFTENSGVKIELPETSISLLSPRVAVETGLARVLVPNQEPSETAYEAIHVKTPAGWKIDSVSEQPAPALPPSHHEQLKQLEWMVGNWVDADGSSSIESSCRWTTNRNFLMRTFKVVIADRVDFEGTQIIGWDPSVSVIRSWTFDSDGGFGVGRWTEGENSWTVRALHVLPDGRQASSTNIYDLIDDNTVQFRSVGRQVDGELLPSIDPVTVSRLQN